MARRTSSQASPQAGPRRRNPAPATALRQGIPASRFNLTPQERALLPDPDWVTEDDADYIIGMRGEREGKPIPLAKVLKRYGYRVED
jgi:hypothetical protein